MGTLSEAQLSEGVRDVLPRVVWDTAHPALHLRNGLHQQVEVIAPQVVKHNGMLVVLGFSPNLRLQALWTVPRYSPVMWQWSRTESPSRVILIVFGSATTPLIHITSHKYKYDHMLDKFAFLH